MGTAFLTSAAPSRRSNVVWTSFAFASKSSASFKAAFSISAIASALRLALPLTPIPSFTLSPSEMEPRRCLSFFGFSVELLPPPLPLAERPGPLLDGEGREEGAFLKD